MSTISESGMIIPDLYPARHKCFVHITICSALYRVQKRKFMITLFIYQIVLEPGRHTYRVTGTAGQQGVYTMEQVRNSTIIFENHR
jgi:hypothetical protein